MPNQWMDDIVKILDDYYNAKRNAENTISKINQIVVDYTDEFKIFEEQFKDK